MHLGCSPGWRASGGGAAAGAGEGANKRRAVVVDHRRGRRRTVCCLQLSAASCVPQWSALPFAPARGPHRPSPQCPSPHLQRLAGGECGVLWWDGASRLGDGGQARVERGCGRRGAGRGWLRLCNKAARAPCERTACSEEHPRARLHGPHLPLTPAPALWRGPRTSVGVDALGRGSQHSRHRLQRLTPGAAVRKRGQQCVVGDLPGWVGWVGAG